MNDFIGDFWGVYIAVITLASFVACGALLPEKRPLPVAVGGEGKRQ